MSAIGPVDNISCIMSTMGIHHKAYRKTSNKSRTLGNKIVDNSDVAGSLPFLAPLDWAKTTARGYKKHLSFGIWCNLYWRFYGNMILSDQLVRIWIADTPWYQGSWGQHGVHLGQTGPRWAPFWPLEPCYLWSLFLTLKDTYLHTGKNERNCNVNSWFNPYVVYWYINSLRPSDACMRQQTSIVSDNGLSPGRRQAIIWTNAQILLIGPLGTKFCETLIEIYAFSFKKMHLKMSSGKWRPFCLGLNVFDKLEMKKNNLLTILMLAFIIWSKKLLS